MSPGSITDSCLDWGRRVPQASWIQLWIQCISVLIFCTTYSSDCFHLTIMFTLNDSILSTVHVIFDINIFSFEVSNDIMPIDISSPIHSVLYTSHLSKLKFLSLWTVWCQYQRISIEFKWYFVNYNCCRDIRS